MRNPESVLNSLQEHSAQSNYVYKRLYRNLYSQEYFLQAYQNIYAKQGNMTAGVDGKTIDAMSIERINRLIEELKIEQYQPQPSKRVYIPKKNGKKRPLGIPTINDKLVQEAVRMILEAIYEGSFEYSSHGFRPEKSCHTALQSVDKKFKRCKWFVEGDIKSFFDNIDHQILINILRKKIKDEKFIRLIQKFLKAGYVEERITHATYSGTPQGGIISPILANIYLDQLDKFIEDYKKNFDKGKRRADCREYKRLCDRRHRLVVKISKSEGEDRKGLIEELKELDKFRRNYRAKDPMDSNYKRMQYVRYADDFIIGVIGSKADARNIKRDISLFVAEKLKLELSEEKTLITKSTKRARFLGYDIRITPYSNETKRTRKGSLARNYGGHVRLEVPTELVKKKLLELGAMKIKVTNGVEIWTPTHRGLTGRDDLSILDQYNGEVRGFCNYYDVANNKSKLHKFRYIMEYSLVRTLCCKYRCHKGKIFKKHRRGMDFFVKYEDKNGGERIRYFWKGSLKRGKGDFDSEVDSIKKPKGIRKKPTLVNRLKNNKCEWCGQETEKLVVHQVRNLKELADDTEWAGFMKKINRKTLIVCEDCHEVIHSADCE